MPQAIYSLTITIAIAYVLALIVLRAVRRMRRDEP